jgi:hypothetical protein
VTPAELDAAVERLLDQAEVQGFARHVTDPAVLDRVAGIVASCATKADHTGRPTPDHTRVVDEDRRAG